MNWPHWGPKPMKSGLFIIMSYIMNNIAWACLRNGFRGWILIEIISQVARAIPWFYMCTHAQTVVVPPYSMHLCVEQNHFKKKPEDHWSCKRSPDILT